MCLIRITSAIWVAVGFPELHMLIVVIVTPLFDPHRSMLSHHHRSFSGLTDQGSDKHYSSSVHFKSLEPLVLCFNETKKFVCDFSVNLCCCPGPALWQQGDAWHILFGGHWGTYLLIYQKNVSFHAPFFRPLTLIMDPVKVKESKRVYQHETLL